MTKNSLVPHIPKSLLRTPPKDFSCSGCSLGKSHATPFRRRDRTAAVGTHLPTDICFPLPVDSITGNRFFATFLDEGSRYLVVKCAPTKTEAANFIKQHITDVHTHTPHRIRHITSDNDLEYYSHDLCAFYAAHNIQTHPSTPHTLQENSLAEGVNRSIMDTARSTLLTSYLPVSLRDYAVYTATDTITHIPHTAHGKISHQFWFQSTPEVHTLLSFGTPGYADDPSPHTKLEPRAKLLQFIGRADYRHYFTFDTVSQRITRCRIADFLVYNSVNEPVCTSAPLIMP